MEIELLERTLTELGITNKLVIILIGTIFINIIIVIIKFILEKNLKDRDSKIHKKNLILTNSITVLEKVYVDLEGLSFFQKGEEGNLLNGIPSLARMLCVGMWVVHPCQLPNMFIW